MTETPPHYQSLTGITPWDFCAGIQTSGNPFADHLRCSAIEYAFRIKEDPSGDLVKAANCLLRAAAALDLNRLQARKPETACIYNNWPFWQDTGSSLRPWVAMLGDESLYSETKEGLFAAIDRYNAYGEAKP